MGQSNLGHLCTMKSVLAALATTLPLTIAGLGFFGEVHGPDFHGFGPGGAHPIGPHHPPEHHHLPHHPVEPYSPYHDPYKPVHHHTIMNHIIMNHTIMNHTIIITTNQPTSM